MALMRFFSFSIMPPPPRYTLFPYTTLFRSEGKGSVAHADIAEARGDRSVLRNGISHLAAGGDRKSTRLNSSHSQISYAVFCLKKKNAKKAGPVFAYGNFITVTINFLIVAFC